MLPVALQEVTGLGSHMSPTATSRVPPAGGGVVGGGVVGGGVVGGGVVGGGVVGGGVPGAVVGGAVLGGGAGGAAAVGGELVAPGGGGTGAAGVGVAAACVTARAVVGDSHRPEVVVVTAQRYEYAVAGSRPRSVRATSLRPADTVLGPDRRDRDAP